MKYPKTIIALQKEEDINNGISTNILKFKAIEIKQDENLCWKDFEIGNLTAAGVDPNTLPTTKLTANTADLANSARKAERTLNQIETIQSIDNILNDTENE